MRPSLASNLLAFNGMLELLTDRDYILDTVENYLISVVSEEELPWQIMVVATNSYIF